MVNVGKIYQFLRLLWDRFPKKTRPAFFQFWFQRGVLPVGGVGWLTRNPKILVPQEDDYDRLPMPTGRPVERALDFARIFVSPPWLLKTGWRFFPRGPSSSGRDRFKATSKTKISAGGGSSCKEAWEEERERHGALNSEVAKKIALLGMLTLTHWRVTKKIPLAQDFEERGQRSA